MQIGSKLVAAVLIILVVLSSLSIWYYASFSKTKHAGTEDFAVYYGSVVNAQVVNYLNKFRLVILEPWAFNSSTLSEIKGIKIAYIDLGEYDNASCSCSVNISRVAIGYDPLWNQVIVNVSSPLWQKYVMCEVENAMKEGFQGVLFDDLDVAEQYPNVSQGIITVLKDVRQMYPNAVIGVNRGFVLLQNISVYINFLLYEDYGTEVIGPGEVTFVQNVSGIAATTSMVRHYNITILALAYANYPEDKYFVFSSNLAYKEGVPLYITNWDVTALFPQNEINQNYSLDV